MKILLVILLAMSAFDGYYWVTTGSSLAFAGLVAGFVAVIAVSSKDRA